MHIIALIWLHTVTNSWLLTIIFHDHYRSFSSWPLTILFFLTTAILSLSNHWQSFAFCLLSILFFLTNLFSWPFSRQIYRENISILYVTINFYHFPAEILDLFVEKVLSWMNLCLSIIGLNTNLNLICHLISLLLETLFNLSHLVEKIKLQS